MNPFTFGNPISNPDQFYGREAEIRKITNRLLSSAHESTSIVGERRIGKTSLLLYLANPKTAEITKLSPEKYYAVYIDFQGLTHITPQRFWERILKKLKRVAKDEGVIEEIDALISQNEFDLFDLEDLFDEIKSQDITTILLMDEFDVITQNPAFGSDFFGGLRSLAIHYGVALVSSTRIELVDLCYSDEIKGSPFFNIFANIILKPFSNSDAEALIDGQIQRLDGVSITADEKAFILQVGGGHPLFLQMISHHIVDQKEQGFHGDELLQKSIKAFETDAHPHFSYFWSHCSESEKITLLSIMALNQQERAGKNQANLDKLKSINMQAQLDTVTLSKRGLIVEKEDAYKIFSPTFISWVTQEISSARTQEENAQSAEDWLRKGNYENIQAQKATLSGFKEEYWHIITKVIAEVSTETLVTTGLTLLLKSVA